LQELYRDSGIKSDEQEELKRRLNAGAAEMDRADFLWQELVKALEKIKELEQENERLKKEIEAKSGGIDAGTF
jgi:hypothetical protein